IGQDRPTQVRGVPLMEASMIRTMRQAMTVGLVALMLGGAAAATETLESVGELANPEGRGTARVMGMDASYVGVAEGADALQWNPAGLGRLQAGEAGWHHLSGLGSAIGESIILGAPVGRLGG